MIVDDDRAAFVHSKTSVFDEPAFWAHADGEHCKIRSDAAAVSENDGFPSVGEALDGGAEGKLDAILFQLSSDECRHFRIKRRHHLIGCFYEVDIQALVAQIFRHLQSDEAAANDHRCFWRSGVHKSFESIHVSDVADGEDAVARLFETFQPRHDRRCTRGEHKHIVALLAFLAGAQIADRHRFLLRLDGDDLCLRVDLQIEPGVHRFHILHQQLLAFWDHTADIIRKAAVCERNIFAALKKHDLRRFIQTAQASSAGCTTGNSADDQNSFSQNKNSFQNGLFLTLIIRQISGCG